MKKRKEIFVGMRFSKEEMERINTIRKELRLNKSEMIRRLVQQAISAENNQFSHFTEEIREVRRRLQTLYQMNRYVASLLSALVRKSSKSNPEEAEKMILAARGEAEKLEL